MGEWKSQRGHVSDTVANILNEAFKKVAVLQWPTLLDLADAIEFASRGTLVVGVHANAPRLGNPKSMNVSDLNNTGLFKTLHNRGQMTSN